MPIITGTVYDDAGLPSTNRIVRAYRRDTGALLQSTLSATAQAGDPLYGDVNLLLLGEDLTGTNSTSIIDTSSFARTVTPVGGIALDYTKWKFAQSSILFDGVNDYLQLDNISAYNLGSINFCIEFWYWHPSTKGGRIYSGGEHGGSIWPINEIKAGTDGSIAWLINYANSNTYTTLSSGAASTIANAWNHVVCNREGNIFRIFINGVKKAEVTWANSFYVPPTGPRIGCYFNSSVPSDFLTGSINSFRFTRNNPRYSADFTPPTQRFANSLSILTDGGFTLNTGTYTGEANVLFLDDTPGTVYNDIVHRTIVS